MIRTGLSDIKSSVCLFYEKSDLTVISEDYVLPPDEDTGPVPT